MNKKATKQTTPSIYAGVIQDSKLTKKCLVIDINEQLFLFNTPQECHIITASVHRMYASFDGFADENKQTVLARHFETFNAEPPKDQSHTQTALMTWFAMCAKAKNRTIKPGDSAPKDPATGRKSTIGTRNYFRCMTPEGTPVPCALKTPQALACLKILDESLTTHGVTITTNYAGKDHEERAITEAKLKEIVYERGAELKTKQDAWRIFQYYRPQLIAVKCIRHD